MKIGFPDFIAKMSKAISKASSGATGFVKSPSGVSRSLRENNTGKLMAFVLLAFVIGAAISQGSYAFADDSATNPFRAIWEAIGELQTKTDSLQSQIDELKEQGVVVSSGEQIQVNTADASLAVDVGSDDFQTVIDVVATNSGEDSAVGVKILTYYQMSLLDVTFIDGAQCTDQARGIIECYVGTIESGGEEHITIYATPSQLDEQAIITADISSITKDADPTNNHAELVFITSEEPEVVEEEEERADSGGSEEQTSEETPSEEQSEETSGGEQSSEEQTGEEQPAEGEQGSEEQTSEEQSSEEQSGEQSGEQTGEEGGEEQSSGEEGAESGGEQSSDQGSESSSDQGSESGGSEESGSDSSSSDSGSSDSGSDSGNSGSDSGSGDGGSSDGGSSGGDSGGESSG